MPDKFKIGDVVRLKSGSDAMTVNEVSGELVTCVWFPRGASAAIGPDVYLARLEKERFHEDSLVKRAQE